MLTGRSSCVGTSSVVAVKLLPVENLSLLHPSITRHSAVLESSRVDAASVYTAYRYYYFTLV
jgi:hypothetical protein